MVKYTKSAILDVFDFIKRLIYFGEISIQVIYIGYLSFRLITNSGILLANIMLLILSLGYLIYFIATTREFYTLEQSESKKEIKLVVKISKRIVSLCVLGISIYNLIINPDATSIEIVLTVLLIFGFAGSIIGDSLVSMINSKIQLIGSSFKYDVSRFSEEHGIAAAGIKKAFKIDLDEVAGEVSEKTVNKIKIVNYKQEQKARRKADFRRKSI